MQDKNVRFIRVNGRVIPIKGDKGARQTVKRGEQKVKKRVKHEVARGKKAVRKRAVQEYHARTSEKQRSMLKSAFKVGSSLLAGVVTQQSLSMGADMADKAASKYESKARRGKYKATVLGTAGAGLAAVGGGSIYKGIKAGSTEGRISKAATKTFMKTKNFKLAAASALLGGVARVAGASGYNKASRHERRAKKVKKVTSRLKQFLSGQTSVGE